MKDNELRGVILQEYYERRRSPVNMLKEEDFLPPIKKDDILHISEQLAQHGLIDWKPLKNGPRLVDGSGKITASGIDVIENEGLNSPIQIFIPQNINISNSTGIQIGNNNSQTTNLNSQNHSQFFENIKDTLNNEIQDITERESILLKLQELEASIGSPKYLSNYQDFMSTAANHMTILAPFLPALSQLIA